MVLGSSQPLTELSTRNISRPVCRADNLTNFMCQLSSNLGASTSWNPQGLSRPVEGLHYVPRTVLRRRRATDTSLCGHMMTSPGVEGKVSTPWTGQYRNHGSIPGRNNRFSVIQRSRLADCLVVTGVFRWGWPVTPSSAEVWNIQPIPALLHIPLLRPQEQINLRLWSSVSQISESLGV
jgi:hypothetical protein